MAKKIEVDTQFVNGKALRCAHCEHDRFWTRSTLMNTKGATFMGFEWANKEANNYVCDQCGHVMWFLQKP